MSQTEFWENAQITGDYNQNHFLKHENITRLTIFASKFQYRVREVWEKIHLLKINLKKTFDNVYFMGKSEA